MNPKEFFATHNQLFSPEKLYRTQQELLQHNVLAHYSHTDKFPSVLAAWINVACKPLSDIMQRESMSVLTIDTDLLDLFLAQAVGLAMQRQPIVSEVDAERFRNEIKDLVPNEVKELLAV